MNQGAPQTWDEIDEDLWNMYFGNEDEQSVENSKDANIELPGVQSNEGDRNVCNDAGPNEGADRPITKDVIDVAMWKRYYGREDEQAIKNSKGGKSELPAARDNEGDGVVNYLNKRVEDLAHEVACPNEGADESITEDEVENELWNRYFGNEDEKSIKNSKDGECTREQPNENDPLGNNLYERLKDAASGVASPDESVDASTTKVEVDNELWDIYLGNEDEQSIENSKDVRLPEDQPNETDPLYINFNERVENLADGVACLDEGVEASIMKDENDDELWKMYFLNEDVASPNEGADGPTKDEIENELRNMYFGNEDKQSVENSNVAKIEVPGVQENECTRLKKFKGRAEDVPKTCDEVDDELWHMYFRNEDEESMNKSTNTKNELPQKQTETEGQQEMRNLKCVESTQKRKALKSLGKFHIPDDDYNRIDSSMEGHIQLRGGKENLAHNNKKKKMIFGNTSSKGSPKSQDTKARSSKNYIDTDFNCSSNSNLRGDAVDRGVKESSPHAIARPRETKRLSGPTDWSVLEDFLWPTKNEDTKSSKKHETVVPIGLEPSPAPLDNLWSDECEDIFRQLDTYDLCDFVSEGENLPSGSAALDIQWPTTSNGSEASVSFENLQNNELLRIKKMWRQVLQNK